MLLLVVILLGDKGTLGEEELVDLDAVLLGDELKEMKRNENDIQEK